MLQVPISAVLCAYAPLPHQYASLCIFMPAPLPELRLSPAPVRPRWPRVCRLPAARTGAAPYVTCGTGYRPGYMLLRSLCLHRRAIFLWIMWINLLKTSASGACPVGKPGESSAHCVEVPRTVPVPVAYCCGSCRPTLSCAGPHCAHGTPTRRK